MCVITETWFSSRDKDNIVHEELLPFTYSLIDVPRGKETGGGVGVMYKSSLNVNQEKPTAYISFDATKALVTCVFDIIRLVSFNILHWAGHGVNQL